MTDKEMFKKTFDTVAAGYDNPAVRFFAQSVPPLIDYLNLNGDERILDVATGTGNAALQLAGHVPRGRVSGVDFSSGMLAKAEEKRAALGLGHVRFSEMDMQALHFPDGCFDLVLCCFGLFFVEDMVGQLGHMADKVAAGGRVAVTSFGQNLFSPQVEMFLDRMERYGVEIPPLTWKRTDTPQKCRALAGEAGLADIVTFTKDIGYYLNGADQWWEVLWNAGYRGLIDQLSGGRQAVFKREHLREVNALIDGSRLWLDINVIYTVGAKVRFARP